MRIWDIEVSKLCSGHLLGEHAELHGLWNILACGKKGYSKHPEALRWKGKQKALYLRHESLVKEIGKRGFKHASPLDKAQATGKAVQDEFLQSLQEQKEILKKKGCKCSP